MSFSKVLKARHAVVGLAAGLVLGVTASAGALTVASPNPAPAQVDISGPCDEAGNINRPCCTGLPNANSSDDSSDDDNSGSDNSGGDNSGGDNSGGDNSGGDNSGSDNSGPGSSGGGDDRDDSSSGHHGSGGEDD